MNKQFMLDVAEIIDAWRLFPRLFLLSYGALIIELTLWAMSLTVISVEQAALVSIVTGLFVPMTNFYMQTGRDWKLAAASQTVTTTQRVETQAQPPVGTL